MVSDASDEFDEIPKRVPSVYVGWFTASVDGDTFAFESTGAFDRALAADQVPWLVSKWDGRDLRHEIARLRIAR